VTALTDVVKGALAALDEPVPVGVGKQPADVGNKPFVVIWPDGGRRYPVTMQGNDGLDETWVCHCFGLSPDAAGIALDALTAAVYGLWRTTVGGRVVQYPEQLTALPLGIDRDAQPALYDFVVEWRLRTSAA
jgi:hypothetical protein